MGVNWSCGVAQENECIYNESKHTNRNSNWQWHDPNATQDAKGVIIGIYCLLHTLHYVHLNRQSVVENFFWEDYL